MIDSRARSIKTRIETAALSIQESELKDSRARSIKTRIETGRMIKSTLNPNNSRARSIKTRIETYFHQSIFHFRIEFASKIH